MGRDVDQLSVSSTPLLAVVLQGSSFQGVVGSGILITIFRDGVSGFVIDQARTSSRH